MNFFNKLFLLIKNIFNKKEEPKKLEPSTLNNINTKKDFTNSLKVTINKKKKNKIETLICPGDGLGIQGPLSS